MQVSRISWNVKGVPSGRHLTEGENLGDAILVNLVNVETVNLTKVGRMWKMHFAYPPP